LSETGASNAGVVAGVLGFVLVILYALRKLKTLSIILFSLFAFFMMAMVIELVPWLHVEPVYSLLHGFLEAIPNYLSDITSYFKQLLGALV
jgi:choline-glycine betaine transporter